MNRYDEETEFAETRRHDEEIEFADNPEPRCACVVLVDVSTSMNGEPINQLNKGIELLYKEISQDDLASLRVELAIVAFNHEVKVMQDFTTIGPSNDPPLLRARGGTVMCPAIEHSMAMLADRKQTYRRTGTSYYRPWLIFITDGEPNDRNQIAGMGQKINQAFNQKELTFFAIGVEEADFQVLRELAPREYPPMKLQGLKFQELFQWLSQSLTGVSNSQTNEQVPLPPAGGWATAPA